jgi:hypothetical protein
MITAPVLAADVLRRALGQHRRRGAGAGVDGGRVVERGGVVSNATDPVFPVADWGACQLPGMTKREYFAAMAMQGIIAQMPHAQEASEIARQSVVCADALLAELAKEPQS